MLWEDVREYVRNVVLGCVLYALMMVCDVTFSESQAMKANVRICVNDDW